MAYGRWLEIHSRVWTCADLDLKKSATRIKAYDRDFYSPRQLQELLTALPQSSREQLSAQRPGFGYLERPNPFFVAPHLLETIGVAPRETSAILISAPAALGKSTLAREIAMQLDAPLWDLAKFNVGSNSFQGTLLAAYGLSVGPKVLDGLALGSFLLLIDALDEGEIRAGNENFEAFLTDLAEAYRQPRHQPTLLLLGRADTTDLVATAFGIAEAPFAQYRIDFFDSTEAYEFIDLRLDDLCRIAGEAPTHRIHRTPFEDARRALVQTVADLLGTDASHPWDSEELRTFLGYAPVLEAVAQYLRVENYQVLKNELAEARGGTGEPMAQTHRLWSFLLDIIRAVLDREQLKIQRNVRGQLEQAAQRIGWSEWQSLYTPAEQCTRLIHDVVGIGSPPYPRDLPTELRGPYESAVQTSLPQHPFVGERRGEFANVVFHEFVFAWGLSTTGPPVPDLIRQRLSDSYLPSPLLGRFLLDFAALRRRHNWPRVEADDFPYIYESLRSQEREDLPINLVLFQPNVDTVAGTMYGDVRSVRDVVFEIDVGSEQEIRFLRRLTNANIGIQSAISLGSEGESFVLGPDVYLECSVLRTSAPVIRVLSRSDESIVLIADRYEPSGRLPELVVQGELAVAWPFLSYPWIPFGFDPVGLDEDDNPEVQESFRHLCRILRLFRSRGYGGLSRHPDIIYSAGVGNSQMARALLEFALEEGLVRRGDLYSLDLERMDQLGIHWTDIRHRRMSEGVRLFLDRFHRRQ